jgi:hypothetical protein
MFGKKELINKEIIKYEKVGMEYEMWYVGVI